MLAKVFKAYDVRSTYPKPLNEKIAWQIGYATAQYLLAEAEPGARAGAARMLELRELESRVAQEEVYLRRTEARALQEVAHPEARAELERRIEEMRDMLLKGGEGSPPSVSPLTGMNRACWLR